MNENAKTIRDLAAYVCDRLAGKVLIHRYDAYSTNSVYLKFDYGVANSLRIADHAGKEHLAYHGKSFVRKLATGDGEITAWQSLKIAVALFLWGRAQKKDPWGELYRITKFAQKWKEGDSI